MTFLALVNMIVGKDVNKFTEKYKLSNVFKADKEMGTFCLWLT